MPVTINGSNTPTAGGVTYGDGTQYATTAAGTSGQVLTSAGASAPTWANPATVNLATGVTGTLPIANGGTGTTSTTFANLTTNVTGTLPIANGGTNSTATPTAGTIPYGTGTALAYTAAGTSGQVLTSAGSGTPTWATPAAGGSWRYISTTTASNSATITIEDSMTAYKMYVVVFTGVLNANNDQLRCQIKLDGSYATGSFYETLMQRCVANSTSFQASADSGTSMYVASGLPADIADGAASGVIYIPNPSQNTRKTLYSVGSGNYRTQSNMTGTYAIAGVMTGIKFFTASATILAGTFILYGVSNS